MSRGFCAVSAAGAAGATAVASALDAADSGNRTATLLSLGRKALSWFTDALKEGQNGKEEV